MQFMQQMAAWFGPRWIEYAVFIVLVVIFLAIDIRTGSDKPVPIGKAAIWSVIWIAVSMGFAGYIALQEGPDKAFLFVTAYSLEKTLAVDNLFVFIAIFGSFSVPDKYHHRILHWGILGALIFRALFIGLGAGLLYGAGAAGEYNIGGVKFKLTQIVFFIFGVIILWSVYGLFKAVRGDEDDEEEVDYTNHWGVSIVKKLLPGRVAVKLDGHNFFTGIKTDNGIKWGVTPLFLCLFVIEISDILFAFDSVPAIFAVTQEPFLVYTSNIFAVLGLRSMYFLLTAAKRALVHLEKAVFIILGFIGLKMMGLAFDVIHVPAAVSLGVVLGLLFIGIAASFIWPGEPEEAEE